MPIGLESSPTTARFADRVSEWEDSFGMAFAMDYGDPEAEYAALRENVVALEWSTIRKWYIEGPDAVAALDAAFSRNVAAAPVGRVLYGVVVDADGLMIEDVTAVKLSDEQVLVFGGDPLTEARLRSAAPAGTSVVDRRAEIAVASLQGPRSRDLLQRLTSADVSGSGLPYYETLTGVEVAGVPATLLRLGFTAELGFEIMVARENADALWDAILGQQDLDVVMMGMTGILVARIEAGMVIGGLEYDRTVSPFECGLGWTVDFGKEELWARTPLAEAKANSSRRLVSIVSEAPVAQLDGAALVVDGAEVGRVTAATASPALGGRSLGLARVERPFNAIGTRLSIVSDGAATSDDAEVLRTPVYDPERSRVKA
ncbi:aminomethyltransferase family protein [Agromyces tropicus]